MVYTIPTMNLICNNCAGARVYEIFRAPYTNPFMWSLVRPDEFVHLINHYNDIDFHKRELVLVENTLSIRIDNAVTIVFIHHFKDERYPEYIKINENNKMQARYRDMDKHILEHYDNRVLRMIGQPTFLISDKYNKFCNGTYTFNVSDLKGINDFSNIVFIGKEKTDLCKSVLCKGNLTTTEIARLYLKNR